MSLFTYILDSALVLIVLLQLKERKMSTRPLIRPLVILAIAVANYFTNIPTAGNDLMLILVIGAVGAVIGTASGLTVIMRKDDDGSVLFRAGWYSAIFWVLGMGSRFVFAVWSTHSGAASIESFSAQHQITSGAAWTDALLAMAVFEVLTRTAVMAYRWRSMESRPAIALA